MNTQDIINELKQSEERLMVECFRIKGIIKHLEKPNKEEEVFAAIKCPNGNHVCGLLKELANITNDEIPDLGLCDKCREANKEKEK